MFLIGYAYTVFFTLNPGDVKSGDLGGHWIGLLQPVHLHKGNASKS
jgi:hypothetical protein